MSENIQLVEAFENAIIEYTTALETGDLDDIRIAEERLKITRKALNEIMYFLDDLNS